jgi:hypothetical protein
MGPGELTEARAAADADELLAWQQARDERLAAEYEAALPELEKLWQEERDERLIAEYEAALPQLEREWRFERLIAEHEAAVAAEEQARREASRRWFRRNWKPLIARLKRDRAAREANRRTVAIPPTRQRGAGRPVGRRTSTAARSRGDDSDLSDPEPEHPLAAGGGAVSRAYRNELLVAALRYANRGWPVLPTAPGEKRPHPRLAPRGVKSATTDLEVIAGWWAGCPDANVAIACGTPGPQVLDADDLEEAAEAIATAQALDPPEVATSRGRHFYFAGQQRGTVGLGYGELRGVASYVLAPPSIHPDGRQYVWLSSDRRPLPPVPRGLLEARSSYGAGVMPDVEHVKPGAMYDFLVDLAVRLARAGIVHEERIARILLAEFKAVRAPGAVYNGTPADTCRIAKWAARSEIAERERWLAERGAPRRIRFAAKERNAS